MVELRVLIGGLLIFFIIIIIGFDLFFYKDVGENIKLKEAFMGKEK
jgi:hypothetical protein